MIIVLILRKGDGIYRTVAKEIGSFESSIAQDSIPKICG